jgi:hypothetical protein
VIEQQSGEENFKEHDISAAAAREIGDEAAFADLKQRDACEDELLVNLLDGRKYRKASEKDQPDKIHPAKFFVFAKGHGEGGEILARLEGSPMRIGGVEFLLCVGLDRARVRIGQF